MSKTQIQTFSCLYDSHTHWWATGSVARRISLGHLKSESEVQFLFKQKTLTDENLFSRSKPLNQMTSLPPETSLQQHAKEFETGGWVLGFGWSQNHWQNQELPHRLTLDRQFGPESLVSFSHADGHALWVNTGALKKAGLWRKFTKEQAGSSLKIDDEGWPTGVLLDEARAAVDLCLPKLDLHQIQADQLRAQSLFHQNGFTHIRDLTANEQEWMAARALEDSGQLKLAVEQFFFLKETVDLEKRIEEIKRVRLEPSKLIRVRGLKIFVDGALGSEGALLSQNYHGHCHHGLQIHTESEIQHIMQRVWSEQLELAVHTIGDQAAHVVVQAAIAIKQKGITGRLHLEHVQILREETLQMMTELNVTCHLQPCHWLDDSKWIEQKIGSLMPFIFPWARLENRGIPFYFGSDSPIASPQLQLNLKAIEDLETRGVLQPRQSFQFTHCHHDKKWIPDCKSVFEGTNCKEVYFNNALVYQKKP